MFEHQDGSGPLDVITAYGAEQAILLNHRGLEFCRRVASILGDGDKHITARELPIAQKLRYHEE